jgi:hypothetical protein
MEITDQRVCGQMIFDVKGLKAAIADLPDDMPVELCGDNGEIIRYNALYLGNTKC